MSGLHGTPSGVPARLLVCQPVQVAHPILGRIDERLISYNRSLIMTNAITVSFQNQTITAFLHNETPVVAMKPICENLGIDWHAQRQRIQRHPVLNSTAVMITSVAEDGKQREMICLPLNKLNGWLFGIDSNRVKPEIKDRVIAYQEKCFDVLAEHFGMGRMHGDVELTEDGHRTFDDVPLRKGIEALARLSNVPVAKLTEMIELKFGMTDGVVWGSRNQVQNAMMYVGEAIEGYLMPKDQPKALAPISRPVLPKLDQREGFTYDQTQAAVRQLKNVLAKDWPEAHDVVDSVGRMLSHYFTIVQETRHQLTNLENQIHRLSYSCRTDLKERFF